MQVFKGLIGDKAFIQIGNRVQLRLALRKSINHRLKFIFAE